MILINIAFIRKADMVNMQFRKIYLNLIRIVLLILITCLLWQCNEPAKEGERMIPFKGTELYCKVVGTGTPLIVLHDTWPLDHAYLSKELDRLGDEFQLIYFDQQGSGRSAFSADTSKISFNIAIEQIETIREELGLKKINLLGHGLGALQAALYTSENPDRVDKLIMVSPISANSFDRLADGSLYPKLLSDSLEREKNALIRSSGFKNNDPATLKRFFQISLKPLFFKKELSRDLPINLAPSFAEDGRTYSKHITIGLRNFDIYPDLQKIKDPVLLIYGEHDLITVASRNNMGRSFDNITVNLLDSSGHFPFMEQPKEFLTAVRSFLN